MSATMTAALSGTTGRGRRRKMNETKAAQSTASGAHLQDLIDRVAKRRDKQAFAELFAHFGPRLKSFMLRAGADPETAEEISQEAMILVWNKAEQYDRKKAALSTWIFTIARNKRIDMLRRQARPEIDPEDYPVATNGPEPDEHVEHGQVSSVLRESIDILPADQREVLEMAFFEDKSHGTISEELGLPLGTVKSRIRLALGRLRNHVGEDYR